MTTSALPDAAAEPELSPRRSRAIEPPAPKPGPERGSVEIEIAPEVGSDGRPTPAGWRYIGHKLREPLPFGQFRGKGGKMMSFLNARQVMDRLDGIVGPGNWESRVRVVRAEHPVSVAVGLGIYGVWKWDVGYSNNPDQVDEFIERLDTETGEIKQVRNPNFEEEPLKAATSDGIKRAGVHWGIGRFLYADAPSNPQSRRT